MGRQATFRVVIVSLCLASASTASAQAWVPDKGSLGIDLDYNFSTSDKVVTDTSRTYENAGATGHQITLGVEYVPAPNLGIAVSLPVQMLTYDGMPYVHPGGGKYDDGKMHTTLTDLRAGLRYQVLDEPVALAPHLAVSIPVADYETVGNAVAGRHLKMLHAGLGLGFLMGNAAYTHLAYEFTLAEAYDRHPRTAYYRQHRSDMGLTTGLKLLDYRLDLHLGANFRMQHDGLTFSEFEERLAVDPNDPIVLYHDAILYEHILLVGGGLGYDISNSLTVRLDLRLFVAALSQNTLNNSIVALGISWSPL
jgi:hypothetical protein